MFFPKILSSIMSTWFSKFPLVFYWKILSCNSKWKLLFFFKDLLPVVPSCFLVVALTLFGSFSIISSCKQEVFPVDGVCCVTAEVDCGVWQRFRVPALEISRVWLTVDYGMPWSASCTSSLTCRWNCRRCVRVPDLDFASTVFLINHSTLINASHSNNNRLEHEAFC